MPTRTPLRTAFSARTVSTHHRIGLVSTYPPKHCGLATFAAALESALRQSGHRVDIVRINDGDNRGETDAIRGSGETDANHGSGETDANHGSVAAELVNGVAASITLVADVLSRCDVAIVQHEYGIYGGADGDEVLSLLELLGARGVPTIVVLHTVPLHPTAHQRSVLEAVAGMADRLVVMTATAHDRLVGSYSVDDTIVVTIPHGASVPSPVLVNEFGPRRSDRPELLTWGLLGPGKGIEHTIDALALLDDIGLRPRYTIAGVTHPKVFAAHGDEYRHSLIQRSFAMGVAGTVSFDDTYRNLAQLTRFVASASVVVLPYDSRDQVTSGVLVDAIAAGRPVIATAFPHAIELLTGGAGIVVPHGDPVALADAIRRVISDPDLLAAMAAEARRLAPSLSWSAVADRYARLSDELASIHEPVAI